MKKRYLALALAAVLAVCAAGCGKEEAKDDSNKTAEKGTVDTTEILQAQMPEEGEEIAVITTSKGVVKMRFFPEEAPKAVENFKTLAKKGYYNGLLFHRVIEDFMVQTGDPKGDGTGGESCWKFPRSCIITEVRLPWQIPVRIQTAVSSLSYRQKTL